MTLTARSMCGRVCAYGVIAAVCAIAGCNHPDDDLVQGYVEGEFLYMAAPMAGDVVHLYAHQGEHVEQGEQLFALDDTRERAAVDQATWQLAQAKARLEDAKKGERPSEIEAIHARLAEAKAALKLSQLELMRVQTLRAADAASTAELDHAQAQRDQDRAIVERIEAQLTTARLGARKAQVEAAAAEVQAREAALAQAQWDLAQTSQAAPQGGVVFDVLYREGEYVAPGRPVVVLLPPDNIKIRTFVPEPLIGTVQLGDRARIFVDGVASPLVGTVTFISPRAEFTPPVIYSRESRSKLVFMIEIEFDTEVAATLHPGQPVDVQIESP